MKALLLFLVFPLVSHAGVLNGGGGKGVFCKNRTPALETLDIYEAKNFYRLTEELRQGDLKTELLLAVKRIDEISSKPFELSSDQENEEYAAEFLKEFLDTAVIIPDGTRLPVTEDATTSVIPNDCEIVQVALYNALGLQIDGEYWNILDARNKAALMIHEQVYLDRRLYGDVNSDETRRYVGRLFSTKPPAKIFEGLPRNGYVECFFGGAGTGAPGFHFVVFPGVRNGGSGHHFSFTEFSGTRVLARTGTFMESTFEIMEFLTTPGQGGLTTNISSDIRFETRGFKLERQSPNVDAKLSIQSVDMFTGGLGAPADGHCDFR